MDKELVLKFQNLFRGYSRTFGLAIETGERSGSKAEVRIEYFRRSPTTEDFERHLKGEGGRISIVPLSEDNNCYFGVHDVDDYTVEIAKYAEQVKNLPLFPCLTKSGGIHGILFSRDGIPGTDMIKVLKHWSGELGYGKSEVFPKQARRADVNDHGNLISLPYYGDSDKCVAWQDGKPRTLTLEEFVEYASKTNPDPVEYLRKNALNVTARHKKASDILFEDGPPCLQLYFRSVGGPTPESVDVAPEGNRHHLLFTIAAYLDRVNDPARVANTLQAINLGKFKIKLKENDGYIDWYLPAFGQTEKEILQIAKDVHKKEYGYKCKEMPMATFCQKALCMSRQFGVGSRPSDPRFTYTGITQVLTDPPSYYGTVDENHRVRWEEEDLGNQTKWRLKVLRVAGDRPPGLPGPAFDAFIDQLFSVANGMERVKPPAEATWYEGTYLALINFIKDHDATTIEDLFQGRAFPDTKNKKYIFRGHDFMDYLKSNKVEFKKETLYEFLGKRCGLVTGATKWIKDQNVSVWQVPFEAVPIVVQEFRSLEKESPF